jgi:hypothetical protein
MIYKQTEKKFGTSTVRGFDFARLPGDAPGKACHGTGCVFAAKGTCYMIKAHRRYKYAPKDEAQVIRDSHGYPAFWKAFHKVKANPGVYRFGIGTDFPGRKSIRLAFAMARGNKNSQFYCYTKRNNWMLAMWKEKPANFHVILSGMTHNVVEMLTMRNLVQEGGASFVAHNEDCPGAVNASKDDRKAYLAARKGKPVFLAMH